MERILDKNLSVKDWPKRTFSLRMVSEFIPSINAVNRRPLPMIFQCRNLWLNQQQNLVRNSPVTYSCFAVSSQITNEYMYRSWTECKDAWGLKQMRGLEGAQTEPHFPCPPPLLVPKNSFSPKMTDWTLISCTQTMLKSSCKWCSFVCPAV